MQASRSVLLYNETMARFLLYLGRGFRSLRKAALALVFLEAHRNILLVANAATHLPSQVSAGQYELQKKSECRSYFFLLHSDFSLP